jgi:programmed cell death protein 5
VSLTKADRKQESEARSHMLAQILEPEAADRLGRIRMVKESRATDVENRLIMLARGGQLRQKVTEAQLKEMLASLSEHEKQSGQTMESVKVVRRGGWDDDDLDDLLNEA